MDKTKISVVLAGHDNTVNQTIVGLLRERKNIEIEHWPVGSVEEKLKERPPGSVDVLLVDLPSFSKPSREVTEYFSSLEAVKAVVAVHIYRNLQPVKKLIEAGAAGYLTRDTSEQQILRALENVNRGKLFNAITENSESAKTLR